MLIYKRIQLSKKKFHKNHPIDYSIDCLVSNIRQTFHELIRKNVYEDGLTKDEIEIRMEQKKELRNSLHSCAYGDQKAKTFIKDYIKDILIKKYRLDAENINLVIPFLDQDKLSAEDKFDIMLYQCEKEYHNKALDYFMTTYHFGEFKNKKVASRIYEISKEDIENVYNMFPYDYLTFYDKLSIVSQRIYQLFKGRGVIDTLCDMKIDGISAGVSGIPEDFVLDEYDNIESLPASYDSIWIFYRGKSIYLSFLTFSSQKELIRVCKNIYRYNNPPQLTETMGYIVNEMKDGSRVSVARPPFSESWVLFIRKFDNVLQENIKNLITDHDNDLPIKLMKWLIKGCQVIGITGEQGCGKTTLLMSLIQFISPAYNLRIQELAFELHLRKIYPKRNIVTFRETSTISGQEGLDFQKKTEGAVNIIGEVATTPVASWLVQTSMVASLFTLFTHHAKTTRDLVTSLRNALLVEGGFHSERIATEQVVYSIQFDIHMKKNVDGHRYIERITEIIPKSNQDSESEDCYANDHWSELTNDMFETKDIVVWKNKKYYFRNWMSKKVVEQISENLSSEELMEFRQDLKQWRGNYEAVVSHTMEKNK